MKPFKFTRSKGYHKSVFGIRYTGLKPYQIRFLEDNQLMRKHATVDDRYVQVLLRILEYEIHHKDHLKLYYNVYTDSVSSYDEILEDSRRIKWLCSICRSQIVSEMGNFEVGNFLCETCDKSHGSSSKMVDERILESSVQFRKYCQDVLVGQQKSYLKYIKNFEKGVKR